MKRYVVGDIHGCYSEQSELLSLIFEDIGTDKDFKIIFVGDYVDRGPHVKDCILEIRYLERVHGKDKIIALKGNHEDMLLIGEYTYARETLASFGGYIPEDVSYWMQNLRRYYEDDTMIVAHAAVMPGVPMEAQSDTYLMWMRYPGGSAANVGKHLYHGHTPYLNGPERAIDRTNVDTGCVYGGSLTAAVVGEDGNPNRFIQIGSLQKIVAS